MTEIDFRKYPRDILGVRRAFGYPISEEGYKQSGVFDLADWLLGGGRCILL
jgi:hypothetical protein